MICMACFFVLEEDTSMHGIILYYEVLDTSDKSIIITDSWIPRWPFKI